MIYELRLPYTRPPLSENYRMHWSAVSREKKQIHHDVIMLAMHQGLPKDVPAVDVTLIWHPADKRRRDSDNPTPTLKAAIDALVKYNLIQDDSSEFVASRCVIGEVRHPAHMLLRIEVLDV